MQNHDLVLYAFSQASWVEIILFRVGSSIIEGLGRVAVPDRDVSPIYKLADIG